MAIIRFDQLSTDLVIENTLQLAVLLGVADPAKTHPVILQAWISGDAAATLTMMWDQNDPVGDARLGDIDDLISSQNSIPFRLPVAAETIQFSFALGIDIYDSLAFLIDGQTWDVVFEIALAEGGMHIRDELAEQIGSIRQMQKDIPAGDPYHQPGPFRQIGGIGPLNP